ncbi:MAG: hypothetical protein ABI615_09890 [Chthoniobacterales bacterium]
MSTIKLTREQLYERVWTTPLSQLAQEFGITDVAIKKTCNRLNVPTPARGYWAKLTAGHQPKKAPLPTMPLVQRREGLAADTAQQLHAGKPPPAAAPTQKLARIELPSDNRSLHPVAREFRTALLAETPDQAGKLYIRQRVDVPSASVSKNAVDAVARSLHAIISELETRGVEFRKFRGKYGHPSFHCGKYQTSLSVEELIETVRREPTAMEKRRPSSEWHLTSQQPSGRFRFSLGPDRYYGRSNVTLIQKPDISLEEFTAQVIEQIWDFFVSSEKSRIESEERWKQNQEKEKIRREEERKRQHQQSLGNIAHRRQENLLRAAQWWRLHNATAEFIDHCEQRWKLKSGSLTPAQEQWLVWARSNVTALSPLQIDYPDPTLDGAFDPSAVPFGGPYPETRKIPRPPSMPSPPPPPSEAHHQDSHQSAQGYPFWLKHQR